MTSSSQTMATRPRRFEDVDHWDIETDVAVVGFGGAGGCAAIEAADPGAEVTIFEVASASGGSTALSSAEIYMGGGGGTRVQRACGYADSTDALFDYLMLPRATSPTRRRSASTPRAAATTSTGSSASVSPTRTPNTSARRSWR